MTIKNYGLMWERDAVRWTGAKGDPGHLKGIGPIGKAKKKQVEVDFRTQSGIYVLYEERHVVYVGQAGSGVHDLYSRLKYHTIDHLADRWTRFSWFGIRKANKNGNLSKHEGDLHRILKAKEMLNLFEGLMINVLEPPLNKQGARWKDIDQYYQYKEGWSEYSEQEILVEIADRLNLTQDTEED